MSFRIPLARPELTEEDRAAVLSVLQTPNLSFGPKLREFEEAISAYIGVTHAVAVNSGTSSLHLAIKLLDLPAGAEVILPSFTFAAVLNVLLQENLRPSFVDVDLNTLNVIPELVEAAITPATKAIIAVHTFGRPAPIMELRVLADRHGIPLVEDACEALGSACLGKKLGGFGEIGTLAFYPNKQITTGEGGMLLTGESHFAERVRRLRNQGRDSVRGEQTEIGYSYRLSEMNCALGVSQLTRIESVVHQRETLAAAYNNRLADIRGIIRPPLHSEHGRISWFCYVVQLGAEFSVRDRDWICDEMARHGIGTGKYFPALHRQPVLRKDCATSLPNTDYVSERVLALPFFNQLSGADIEEVCSALGTCLGTLSRRST